MRWPSTGKLRTWVPQDKCHPKVPKTYQAHPTGHPPRSCRSQREQPGVQWQKSVPPGSYIGIFWKMDSLLIWRKERGQGLSLKPATGTEQGEKAAGFSALPWQTLGLPTSCLCSREESVPPFLWGWGGWMPQTLQRVFLLAALAGTTYVSWTVPWKAVTWAGSARLPLCSRASRCHPLCLPPSPAAAAERGAAGAKNNEPPSGAARAVPVPQALLGSLRLSRWFTYLRSVIYQLLHN